MKRDLHQRILILVLIPSVLMGLSFVWWFSSEQVKELQRDMDIQAEIIAQRLGMAMEYGLFSDNSSLIHQLSREALNEVNVRAILTFDSEGQAISHVGPNTYETLPEKLPNTSQKLIGDNSIMIIHPVTGDHAVFYGISLPQLDSPIGWLVIELSKANMLVERYEIILINLLIFISALALSLLFSIAITRSITSPLAQIQTTVTQLSHGMFNARVGTLQSKQMNELGSGINSLADSLESAYTDMQKNIDQATNDLRETLETLEIQNIELDIARREALDASRIKSEFLSNMSHEIRTPLNGVIGFIRLLMKSNLTPRQEDYSKTILSSSESLLSIINDVLDFAKIEAGKLALDNMTLDLNHIIEDVLVMLAPSAHSRQIDLVPLYYADVPDFIIGDTLRIKQVVTNLVNNAIKFTEKGQVIVRTSVEHDYGNSMMVKISVSDTGIGLTEEQKKALFKSFQQANTSTAREYGGTGLGLVISKKIVEQMSGDIGIESEYGTGSTFWFTMRVDLPTQINRPDLPQNIINKTVVLYDTNPAMQSSLHHTIERYGISVVDATSIENLLDICQDNPAPDIAIIGFGQSSQVNHDLHRKISFIVKDRNIVTLVLSNVHEDNINLKLIERNASAYLSKPFHTSKLIQILCGEPTTAKDHFISEGCRILAVDDNSANLKLLQMLLEDMGIETVTATSGQMAINILEKQTFDLIFMDIQMPGMDGLEATKIIRSKINHPRVRIPVIALTAHAMANEKERLLKSGMDDYLTKPIDEQVLAQTIYKWTGKEIKTSLPEYHQLLLADSSVIKTIDLHLALKRANFKTDLAMDMFHSLIQQLITDQKQVTTLYEQKSYKPLLEVVHRIHGASHYCAVPELTHTAERFEVTLKQDNTEEYATVYKALNTAIDNLISWNEKNDFNASIIELAANKTV